ncbi:organomercurial transporter MerC [Halomonas sp.]|jgi:mercuric ion transport protein|uniref:organomercurial transporter MerC n=1 Tax=Halomonas sp. TaxID=1486246 RepID=UPI0035693D78
MNLLTRITDKAGPMGSVVSGMGCAVCFPALASIGATLGLGFLASWERVFITTLIPLFAVIALVTNILTWRIHRQRYRGLLGVFGPLLVLVGVVPFQLKLGQYATYAQFVFYTGLTLMIISSVWNALHPAKRHCALPHSAPRDRRVRLLKHHKAQRWRNALSMQARYLLVSTLNPIRRLSAWRKHSILSSSASGWRRSARPTNAPRRAGRWQ